MKYRVLMERESDVITGFRFKYTCVVDARVREPEAVVLRRAEKIAAEDGKNPPTALRVLWEEK